ncbi:ribonuclease R [uncultured Thiothrix sp.]|uniref:ribonuclease R n=1 Tax=uncultured Thiothrix sp. TaxID=223185 RepID=UPI002605FCD2|nr:ribonuclease R [uncultured Thiothrix sp.]
MKLKDPYLEREAEKYDNPIPSREVILQLLTESTHPLDFPSLAAALGLSAEIDIDALRKRLRAMERDGQILFNRRRQYVPVARADLISGRVMGHPDGFGFLIPDDGSPDLFLHAKQMDSVMHGDRVLASVRGLDPKGRREGAVVEVLERATEQVVGRLLVESGIAFVVPDNKRLTQEILIPPDQLHEAKPGQIVVAAIIEHPTKRSRPIGKIVEVLGDHMAPGMEIDIAIRSHELPFEWPPAVTEEADRFGYEVPERAKQGREDLRDLPLVTIDGADAKDFDDAVFCSREADHWRLLVAIADVSHYVKPGTALDKEATLRGTSVYFPGKVIPMLPEILSNGLCSLNPQVDRLCMLCEIRLDDEGNVLDYQFKQAVMNSAARLTYDQVAAMVVDHDAAMRKQYADLVPHLDNLYALYHTLSHARMERGTIDFETTETKIIFGEDRKIDAIEPSVRNDAHKIIEECMILANVCAARFLKEHEIPALHRVHAPPTNEKLEDLRAFLAGVGLSLGGGLEPEPADYARVLQQVQGRADFHLIQTVLLRSQSQAQYSPDAETGHFGLAHEDYAHFTSPIRRYPDLLVHRAIRHILTGGTATNFSYSLADMQALGEHCSMAERRADDASRDVTAWLKCEYMQEHVGDVFDGIVSAVTNFGLFVELSDIYVEGLVHVTALTNDYYRYDPVRHRLTGESSGRTFRLADSIRVKVARVDLDERKIDFILADGAEKTEKRSKAKLSKPSKSTKSSKKPLARKKKS